MAHQTLRRVDGKLALNPKWTRFVSPDSSPFTLVNQSVEVHVIQIAHCPPSWGFYLWLGRRVPGGPVRGVGGEMEGPA